MRNQDILKTDLSDSSTKSKNWLTRILFMKEVLPTYITQIGSSHLFKRRDMSLYILLCSNTCISEATIKLKSPSDIEAPMCQPAKHDAILYSK